MKFIDINKTFTDRINEYLSKGYTFNASSMSGSQGEVAKVDLTNETEIIRILIRSFSENERHFGINAGLEVFVGRVTDPDVRINSDNYWASTIWNDKLEEISSDKFYAIGENRYGEKFFGSKEEARKARDLHISRLSNRDRDGQEKKTFELPQQLMDAIKTRIRAKRGIRRVSNSDITAGRDRNGYYYAYRGTACYLH